ncbi:uncharacterized protein ACA1_335680, partial [Acanthamoeba castellanii str. Neff]
MWAVKSLEGERPQLGTNLFTDVRAAKAKLLSANSSAAQLRSFADPRAAAAWLLGTSPLSLQQKQKQKEAHDVIDIWRSPLFEAGPDKGDPLAVIVEGSVSYVGGYEAWFEGEKTMASTLKLPRPTADRAALYGCYEALRKCVIDHKTGSPGGRQVMLCTDSPVVYAAVTGKPMSERGEMPSNCTVLARRLRELCEELPVTLLLATSFA